MNNPYHAPTADLSHSQAETEGYMPDFMSASGRIGRVRYLAYTVTPSFGLMFVTGILLGILTAGMKIENPLLPLLCYIPMFILLFIMGARRLNDLNLSGWLSLFSLIPFVNLLFGLVLLFIPGNDGSNRYGPAPQKNTTGVKVLAWSGPLLLVAFMGVMAAIAIPAYQSYVKKSKEAQTTSQPAPSVPHGDE